MKSLLETPFVTAETVMALTVSVHLVAVQLWAQSKNVKSLEDAILANASCVCCVY